MSYKEEFNPQNNLGRCILSLTLVSDEKTKAQRDCLHSLLGYLAPQWKKLINSMICLLEATSEPHMQSQHQRTSRMESGSLSVPMRRSQCLPSRSAWELPSWISVWPGYCCYTPRLMQRPTELWKKGEPGSISYLQCDLWQATQPLRTHRKKEGNDNPNTSRRKEKQILCESCFVNCEV